MVNTVILMGLALIFCDGKVIMVIHIDLYRINGNYENVWKHISQDFPYEVYGLVRDVSGFFG